MGLDMYLRAELYLSPYSYNEKVKAEQDLGVHIAELLGGAPGPVTRVAVNAMYWRKANQIHGWFVREVQGGKDECQKAYVTREDLTRLEAVCKRVLAQRASAPDLLPVQEGFFFGGDEYDARYFEDVKKTAKRIGELLDDRWKSWEFYYQASW